MEVARLTAEFDLDVLSIRSEITGKPPEILVADDALVTIGRALNKLVEMPEYVAKAHALIRDFIPVKQQHVGVDSRQPAARIQKAR
jgi:hypothetical protein